MRSTPSRRASSSRSACRLRPTSTTVAPTARATCAHSSPIAPGPITTTTSPASDGLCSMTACTATASGSLSEPAAIDSPSGSLCTVSAGITSWSASPPSTVVPIPSR